MDNHAIRTARLTDGQIVDLLIAIRDDVGFDSATLRFGAGASENIDPNTAEARLEEYQGNSHGILSLDVRVDKSKVDILFRRGICADSDKPDQDRQSSPYFDEIFVRRPPNAQAIAAPAFIMKCLGIIEGALPGVPRVLQGQGQDVIATFRAEMSALNETYRRMHEDFADERNKFFKGFEEQRQSVEEERRATKAKLEAEAEQRKQEFQRRMESEEAKLSQRQFELNAREQELDNRQHMHVRRDLRKNISEEFRRRAGEPVVSIRAAVMRWAIFGLTLIAGIGMGDFGLRAFYLLVSAEFDVTDYWMLVARAAILSLGGVGFFLYAIQWLRSIYLDDVRTARRYDSYRDDIDRASFAIETIIEIGNEKQGVAAPEAWIEGVCRNLFRSDVGDKAKSSSQTDAFIELLRSISSASVGPNGAEVTLDRKGSQRLAKRMSAGDG